MRSPFACLWLCAIVLPRAVLGAAPPAAPAYDPPFIISCWVGPTLAETTIERYREMADCGFNVVLTPLLPTGGPTIANNEKILDLCRAVGMKAMVMDPRMLLHQPEHPAFEKNLDAIVATYANHPALAGYLIMDEPSAESFPLLGALTQGLLQRDPRRLPFVNLLPTYADRRQLGVDDYETYLRRYIATVKPRLVQWDHYCLYKNGEGPSYFENLEIASRICREANLPFAQTILAVPHTNYRDPSAADLRWQVYTSLCYGAKGILYFTYWTDTFSEGGYHNAIINERGRPSEKYDIVRGLNQKIKALTPTLLTLHGVRVAHTPPLPQGAAGLDETFPITRTDGGPLVLGWLRDDLNRDYLFLVNRSFQGQQTFSVFVRENKTRAVEISQSNGGEVEAEFDPAAQRLSVPLQAGEGRLFRFDR